MMYYGWYGWTWMLLMPLFWIVLLGVIVWAVVRIVQRPTDRWPAEQRRETPQEILDRRFASGEIDAETYTQARDRLAVESRDRHDLAADSAASAGGPSWDAFAGWAHAAIVGRPSCRIWGDRDDNDDG